MATDTLHGGQTVCEKTSLQANRAKGHQTSGAGHKAQGSQALKGRTWGGDMCLFGIYCKSQSYSEAPLGVLYIQAMYTCVCLYVHMCLYYVKYSNVQRSFLDKGVLCFHYTLFNLQGLVTMSYSLLCACLFAKTGEQSHLATLLSG